MNKFDLLNMSLRNLWRRKTRSLLTVLGVVIGTSSIVVMISLGLALDAGFQEQLQQMGDLNIISVYEDGNQQGAEKDKAELNDKYVGRMRKIPGVEAVMASRSVYVRIAAGRKVCSVQLMGIDPAVQEAFGFQAEEGRLLQEGDKEGILFGNNLPGWFWNPNSNYYYEEKPVDVLKGQLEATTNMSYGERRHGTETNENKAKVYRVYGVGVLAMSNGESDYQAYAVQSVVDKILKESQDGERGSERQSTRKYDRVSVRAKSIDDVENVQKMIQDMGFHVSSMLDFVRQMQQTSRRMQAILGGIGAISLLVAGIGITNTMVMSIYERTREIGVMKVLGASLKDIRNMFLLESAYIGFAGGILGIGLSFAVSAILNRFGSNFMDGYMYGMGNGVGISLITWELAVGAVVFSVLIGLLAGYSPARRAMNLPVLQALKNVE